LWGLWGLWDLGRNFGVFWCCLGLFGVGLFELFAIFGVVFKDAGNGK
jgi:hypothetical protein